MTLGVGATLAVDAQGCPGLLAAMSDNGFRPRSEDHQLLGFTFSRPGLTVRVVGLAYTAPGGVVKEDLLTVDEATGRVEMHHRGRYQEVDPRYAGTHRGPKDYYFAHDAAV